MKRRVAKAGFWVLILAMGGTTAAAQTSYAQAFYPIRGGSGNRNVVSLFRAPKLAEVESPRAVAADGSSLPDAPSAVAEQAPAETSPPPKAPLPSAGRSMGATLLIANGFMLGSTIANAEMIARCRPTSCQAVPDAIRSRGALYGIGVPATLAVSYISYRLKRGGTKLWILPVAVITAGNIVYAVHASHFSAH